MLITAASHCGINHKRASTVLAVLIEIIHGVFERFPHKYGGLPG